MRSTILLALALALAPAAGADEPLHVSGAALGPAGVLTRKAADVMGNDGPSYTPLLVIDEPALRGASRISGRVEAFEIESEAWLELAAVYPDGRRRVTRSIDPGGSGARLRGSEEPRRFELEVPVDAAQGSPVRLELGVAMLGPGVVSVSELRLEANAPPSAAGFPAQRGLWLALAALASVALLAGVWLRRQARGRLATG
jgi:hypothetical protein